MSNAIKRPVARYFGGKFRSAERIISYFPPHRCYTEAFGGAASVLLKKPRVYAEIYNDLDGEIVNLFRVLQDPATAEQLIRDIELTPYAREHFVAAYQAPPADPVKRALNTVIKAFMGFGSNAIHVDSAAGRGFNTRLSTGSHGPKNPPITPQTGFRADASRSGTTPAHDWRNYPGALPAIIDRLRGVVIENRNALEVIARFDRGDALHYVDPPYVHSTRANARKDRYRHELTNEQHGELAAVLNACKGMVVLSGFHSPLYDDLYKGWHVVEYAARGDRARAMTEVLWINEAAAHMLPYNLFAPASGT